MAVKIRETTGYYQTVPVLPTTNLLSSSLFTFGTAKNLFVAQTDFYLIDNSGNTNLTGVTAAIQPVVEISQLAGQAAVTAGTVVQFDFVNQWIDMTQTNNAIGTVLFYDGTTGIYTVKLFEYLNGVPTV